MFMLTRYFITNSLISLILIGLVLIIQVSAKADWFDKGKELLGDFSKETAGKSQLSTDEIGSGLKEALRVGTETVVAKLGRQDGFNTDPAIHIPLPDTLKPVQSTLEKLGMSSSLDELELRLNRAAEAATPKAKQLFWNSISEMTLDDVNAIYNGPEDAATRYFQDKMTPELSQEMTPIVDQSLSQVGAIQSYDSVMEQYRNVPFVPDVKADLNQYVVTKGIDGIFHYLAIQEAEIRKNPAKQTTQLLKKVFGGQ